MSITNKYIKRSRISEAKFREFVRHFSLDMDARKIAMLTRLNRNTVNRYTKLVRTRIAEYCEAFSPFLGEIEVDESYFGAKRIKGKRGRGAYGKTPVFGILQRGGHVYTEIVPDCARKTLQAIIRGRIDPDSVIHSDAWRGYSGLVDLGFKKHYRVHHGANEFANGKRHINGIESFWSFAKRRLMKFHGIRPETFYFHLKECEFRFNHRHQDLYQVILKMVRKKPLS
jgi:transposase-like protein